MAGTSINEESESVQPEQAVDPYEAFLDAKGVMSTRQGFEVADDEIHPILLPHQRAVVRWAVAGGRRALFESFGLGKGVQQLEILRLVLKHLGSGRCLIVAPLGVRQEFKRDAAMVGTQITFVRRTEEVLQAELPSLEVEPRNQRIYVTNYESIRDGRLDPNLFDGVSLDEAGCLRGFGGTKVFREFMRLFEGNQKIRFRFVATATPSPNEYIELLAYAAFLEIMDVGGAKTRFFKRSSTQADKLTLHPHKEREFWLWMNSWAIFLQKPSDLGFSDEGYELPPMEVRWHEIPTDHDGAGSDRDGQARMFRNAAIGVQDAAAEKRRSLDRRIEKMMELRAEAPEEHRLLWHDLEDERKAIEVAIPTALTVYGSQGLEERERCIIDFSEGRATELAAKPVLAGSGCNFQRYCRWAIFLGIGFKFHDFIQAIHRVQRYLQDRPVKIDLIYTEAERQVRKVLEGKWQRHIELVGKMTEIIREFGFNRDLAAGALARTRGVVRTEVVTEHSRLVNNDCILEARSLESDSAGMIVTSIPFSTQYEYTPAVEDFGHTDNDEHFWRQMEFLAPELLRVLQPGRVMAIHCKDRITPGGMNGYGFQTLSRFSDQCAEFFERRGFGFLARKTVVTDVVRENNQTYRLGWSEQCKDGSRMGCGAPEYVLLFRKPPTDRSNGYADIPVVKDKPLCDDHGKPAPFDSKKNWRKPIPGTGYSRWRWQLDAHGFARSSGDRLLSSDELRELPHATLYKLWRDRSLEVVYNFEAHQAIGEDLDHMERLPATFMLLPPHSWHPDVWTNVARMRTLNMVQAQKGREMHLCPLQFDIVERLIRQFTNEGDVVLDPFAGIGTVPYMAIKMRRRAVASELSGRYFGDMVFYVDRAEKEAATPTLFDLLDAEEANGDLPG